MALTATSAREAISAKRRAASPWVSRISNAAARIRSRPAPRPDLHSGVWLFTLIKLPCAPPPSTLPVVVGGGEGLPLMCAPTFSPVGVLIMNRGDSSQRAEHQTRQREVVGDHGPDPMPGALLDEPGFGDQ